MLKLPSYIWQIQGAGEDGPNVVIFGGTHGDEQGGIAAVRLLLLRLGILQKPSGKFRAKDVRGNIFIGFGNPEAIIRGSRSASDGWDLNRSCSKEEIDAPFKKSDRPDLLRARELAPILRQADFHIDVHSMSSPSEPFVCVNVDSPWHYELFEEFSVRHLFCDRNQPYTSHGGTPKYSTTDGFMDLHGGSAWSVKHRGSRFGVGFCYETGWARDASAAERIAGDLVRILARVGCIPDSWFARLGVSAEKPNLEQEFFVIREPIVVQKQGFAYSSELKGGCSEFKKGNEIGRYSDGEIVRAPYDCVCVFPIPQERFKAGKACCWLAVREELKNSVNALTYETERARGK